jgi:hypothetical protein
MLRKQEYDDYRNMGVNKIKSIIPPLPIKG